MALANTILNSKLLAINSVKRDGQLLTRWSNPSAPSYTRVGAPVREISRSWGHPNRWGQQTEGHCDNEIGVVFVEDREEGMMRGWECGGRGQGHHRQGGGGRFLVWEAILVLTKWTGGGRQVLPACLKLAASCSLLAPRCSSPLFTGTSSSANYQVPDLIGIKPDTHRYKTWYPNISRYP